MIYIFCPRGSDSAAALVTKINELGGQARRLRRNWRRVQAADLVVNWGTAQGIPEGYTRILNARVVHNKYQELRTLAAAGVSVPPHGLQRREGDWLARRFVHQAANDLRANLRVGDYYVQFMPTVREFRIHVFRNLSIRAAIKVPRVPQPNPRFRTWEDGWRFDYGAACQQAIRQSVRDAAKAAVTALGYDFGAVDVGVQENGRPIVFEVNSAPGLDGETPRVYATKILEAERG